MKQVQTWLGHADPGFTLRTYIHLMDSGVGSPDFLDQAILSEIGPALVRPPLSLQKRVQAHIAADAKCSFTQSCANPGVSMPSLFQSPTTRTQSPTFPYKKTCSAALFAF